MAPKTTLSQLTQIVEDNIIVTKKEFDKINSNIYDLKKDINKLLVVSVKNGNDMVASYNRADFELNLDNEIKARPTFDEVIKLMQSAIDQTPRKKLSKWGQVAKEWSAIINFVILVLAIFLLLTIKAA